ncbi:MAG: hypothetical protein BME93_01090 [Methanosarcinales archaeon Met12]|nr:MAG: hypothetical protein BME93_01090 [Methanosarcinales archaeon Met12]
MKGPKKLFLQEKPASILQAVAAHEMPYISLIAKEVDSTYAHTTNTLSTMERYGLLTFSRDGRTKYIELTSAGWTIVRALEGLISAFDGTKPALQTKDMTELSGKIKSIYSKIDAIYEEEFADKRSLSMGEATRISRRLGPYCREISKIENLVANAPSLQKDFENIKKRMDELMELRKSLTNL